MLLYRYITLFITSITLVSVGAQPLFHGTSKLDNPYGICSHVSRPGWEADYCTRNMQLCADLGITNLRTDYDQSTWQNSGNKYFDAVFSAAEKHKVSVLPIITYSRNDDDKYRKYLNNVLSAYRKSTGYWEAYNEPDLIKTESAVEYTARLKYVYESVKAQNSRNKVLLGGIASIYDGFLDQSLSNGATKYFDILNIHCYNDPEDLINVYSSLKTIMSKHGIDNKPVWLTETGGSTIQLHNFYTDLLPVAFRQLNINPAKSTVGIVYDDGLPDMMDYAGTIFSQFKSVRYISVKELANITPHDVAVLLPANGEYFPKNGNNALLAYVKSGGTVICPKGAPFYYDSRVANKQIQSDGSMLRNLHMGLLYFWTDAAKRQHADVRPTAYQSSQLQYAQSLGKEDGRYLTTANLQQGDRYISLIDASNGQYRGSVAGIYRLNSNLKGNIIVSTLMGTKLPFSEEIQANWLPRTCLVSFAYGVDKVFYYRMRAYEDNATDREQFFGLLHKDFTPKPAYAAYKTLISLCPSGSTRPVLKLSSGLYTATWQRPDGRRVTAYWSVTSPHTVTVSSRQRAISTQGQTLTPVSGRLTVTSAPVYLIDK